jgi:hypothetical protein
MKYKITIRRTLTEDYEMTLENEKLMAAFDEARKLVVVRNERSKIGHFAVIKIEELKEKENGTSSNVSQGVVLPEPPNPHSCCG